MTQSATNAAARVADLCVAIFATPNVSFPSEQSARHALADWFANHVCAGDSRQISQIRTPPTAGKSLSSTERMPPSPRNAAARLCTIMLDDIYRRLDADTAPDLVLSDVDVVRAMAIQYGFRDEFTDQMHDLYARCEPVPEPVFSAWHRQYRPDHTKPWELVVIHNTHAEAHRSLVKAQAACPGEHRIVGVVA